MIPFGIESKFADKNLEMNERLLQIKNTYDRYFLFIGRMVSYKGVNILLQAMQSVPQNLVLIGKGPFLETWKKLSLEMGVSERVHFVGPVESNIEFGAYLHGCDALVLPSINEAEAFGLVLLEAMSCKKPVITTDLKSGVKFVNVHGQTGLEVPRSDSVSLAKAMNSLRLDDDLRFKLGQQAFEHFSKNFLIQLSLQKHLEVYQTMARKVAA